MAFLSCFGVIPGVIECPNQMTCTCFGELRPLENVVDRDKVSWHQLNRKGYAAYVCLPANFVDRDMIRALYVDT